MPRFEDLPKKTFKPKRRNSWDLASILEPTVESGTSANSAETSPTHSSIPPVAESADPKNTQTNRKKQSEKQTPEMQTSENQTATSRQPPIVALDKQSEIQTSEKQTSENQTALREKAQEKRELIEPSEKQTSVFQQSEIQQSIFQQSEKQTTSTDELGGVAPATNQSDFQTSGNQTGVATTLGRSPNSPATSGSEGSTGIAIRKSVPAKDAAAVLSFGGFLPLSCQAFAPEVFQELKPGEFKVLLYLLFLSWRYPEKLGHVRAALPYLERGTGITRSAVHDHLKGLTDRGYIKCQEKNTKIGNLYFVSDALLWKSEKKTAGKQTADFRTDAVSISDGGSPENGLKQSEKRTEELDLLDPLDLSKLDTEVGDYLATLKATKKRESEREAFELLKRELPPEELLSAFRFVRDKGTLTGERCHSPFSYLAKTVDQVLAVAMPKATASASSNVPRSPSSSPEEEAVFSRLKDKAWPCFVEAYPSESDQKAVIDKINQERARLANGFLEPPHIARHMAVVSWYEKQKLLAATTSKETLQDGESVN